jgi:hypothetical protein
MHPLPQVEPPKISTKGQQTVVRRRLIMESENEHRSVHSSQRSKFYAEGLQSHADYTKKLEDERLKYHEASHDLNEILWKNVLQKKVDDSDESSNDDEDIDLVGANFVGIKPTKTKKDDPVLQAHSLRSRLERRKQTGPLQVCAGKWKVKTWF